MAKTIGLGATPVKQDSAVEIEKLKAEMQALKAENEALKGAKSEKSDKTSKK